VCVLYTHVDWSRYFPPLEPLATPAAVAPATPAPAAASRAVEWVDVGCGYGGLLMSMATEFPDKLMLGMEIRHKVAEFAHEKILSLRREQEGSYQNVDVIQTNTMKYVPQFFSKGQLEKMMFCFPDPHFKKNTHRRRIISADMNAEYAYCLREGGLAYIVTDVLELHEWMVRYLEEHPLFDRLTAEEEAADPVVPFIRTRTDESIKVERNQGQKYSAVYRRRADASGWGLSAADCHASGAARILAEARLSGNWIATADGCPDIAGRHRAYAVQQAMCMLAAGPDSTTAQHTERGKALGENLGEQCGWKLLTDWSSDGQAKASSVGAALNGETHAATVAKEKLQAAAEAAAIKGGKGQHIRAPLFTSALREVSAEDPSNSALVLPKVALNAQCTEGNLGLFLRTELVRDRGSGKAGAYTASDVWSAVGEAAPVLEVLGSRLLANGLTNWERAADAGGQKHNAVCDFSLACLSECTVCAMHFGRWQRRSMPWKTRAPCQTGRSWRH
jgi:tRNA (guanine-N7-)-methyltransferase